MKSSHYQTGRAWAQTATFATIERARRINQVANSASDPSVVVRVLFGARDADHLADLVDECFEQRPDLEAALEFARGVADADPRPVAVSA